MASCSTKIRRLTRGISPLITVLLILNILLILWKSRPCSACPACARSEKINILNLNAPKSLDGEAKVETHEIDRESKLQPETQNEFHQDEFDYKLPYNITESDIVSLIPVKLDLKKYRRLLKWKLSELEHNGVVKTIADDRKICNWDVAGGPCVDKTCKAKLPPPDSDENLVSVLKPLTRIKPTVLTKVTNLFGHIPRGYRITFLTASSSNHFMETQAMLKNFHKSVFPRLTNYTMYFYDLGLTASERKQLKKWCKCEVRTYPVNRLPKRFGFLRGFTWKTFMINAHLPTTDYVVWVDSSVRFKNIQFDRMFEAIRARGLIFGVGAGFSIAEHTSKAMFDYYGDVPCQYAHYSQGTAGFQMIYNEPFMREMVFKPWAACALDPLCMCENCKLGMITCNQKIRKYAKCHRTDQSAHSLILVKLFREKIENFYTYSGKLHYLRRHETANYFDELEAATSGKLYRKSDIELKKRQRQDKVKKGVQDKRHHL